MFTKRSNAAGDTSNGVNHIGALISQLLSACSPLAIIWLVVAIIVLAVQGVPFGTFSHICQEVLKGIDPSGTNLDSTAAVVVIALLLWVVTAHLHVHPRTVGSVFKISMPVRHARHIGGCVSQATARICSSCYEIGPIGFHFLSALAKTTIKELRSTCRSSAHWRISDYFKLSKGLTNQGYFSGHRCMYTAFMFSEVRWRIPSHFTIIFNSLRNSILSIAKSWGASNGSAVSAGTYLTALF
jgi:hypothetical protein